MTWPAPLNEGSASGGPVNRKMHHVTPDPSIAVPWDARRLRSSGQRRAPL